jgi:uncharacterized protein (TIGR03435 family)
MHFALAQEPAAPAFEVASLKISGQVDQLRARMADRMADHSSSGFMPGQNQRVEIEGYSAAGLVAAAYQVPLREIEGPSWIFNVRYTVSALIPAGRTRKDAPEMLRTLLMERLALKAHRDTRKVSGYVLSVAKNGPTMTDTGPKAPKVNPTDYVRRIKPGFVGSQLDHIGMAQLANFLANGLKAPVADQTGLTGHYDLVIQGPPEEMNDELGLPGLYQRILSEYGLRLEGGKVDAPFLVIDNISKTPKEN